MVDTVRDSLDLNEEDRLPWLESAEDYDDRGEYSPVRIALFVLAALVLLGLIAAGIYWLQNRNDIGRDGDGALIAAQEGDYKVRPDDPQVKTFEGEGDASFDASEGQGTPARLGTQRPAETPMTASNDTPEAQSGGVLVQLGAFSSAGQADGAWTAYARRFDSVSKLPKRVVEATVDGGTVYRLNAVAADANAAQRVCNGLKAAGETCLVVR